MIKIKNLQELYTFEEYIKGQQPLVRSVYTSAIYFSGGYHDSQYSIQFNVDRIDFKKEAAEIMLKAINAACNTEFEFDFEDETE